MFTEGPSVTDVCKSINSLKIYGKKERCHRWSVWVARVTDPVCAELWVRRDDVIWEAGAGQLRQEVTLVDRRTGMVEQNSSSTLEKKNTWSWLPHNTYNTCPGGETDSLLPTGTKASLGSVKNSFLIKSLILCSEPTPASVWTLDPPQQLLGPLQLVFET